MQNSFDQKAKTWDQPFRIARAQAVANAIREVIPKNHAFRALEYGCGTGLVSFFLRDMFSSITLVDSSEGMLEVVREKIAYEGAINMKAMHTDALDMQIKNGMTFDVIFNLLVLHHIPDTRQVLSDWHKYLIKGGYLFVVDLDPENGLFHKDDFEGHNGFDRNVLRKVATEAGFKNISFATAHRMCELGRDGCEHVFTLFLMVARKNS